MRVKRTWAILLLFSLASCAAQQIRSSYRIYPVRAPSAATSFSVLGRTNVAIVERSHSTKASAPIRLTASDGTGLELQALRARTVIDGPIAFTELKLSFHNPRKRELEGRFEIVLPPSASVARLAMKLGDAWQDAEVVSRRRGQEVYESFLHQQVDPVLLEAAIGNRFRARVYPIPAKGNKEIIISYTEELPASGEYRLALGGLPPIDAVDVDVRHGDKRERIDGQGAEKARDIVVQTHRAANVALRADELVMMRWVPESKEPGDIPTKLSILVDSSASAAGIYGDQVRAIESLVGALARAYGDDLELEVAAYDNDVATIFQGRAIDYGSKETASLLGRSALGATNLSATMEWARERGGRLLVVGDGIATTKARELHGLANALAGHVPERIDVLSFAHAQNRDLLTEIARQEGARAGVVLSADDSPELWAAQLGKAAPRAHRIDVAGAAWVWPEVVQSSLPGEAVTAFARFDSGAAQRMREVRIETESEGGTKTDVVLPVADGHAELLQRQWAEVQLQNLQKLQRHRRTDVRQALIESLSQRFRILTSETSFLMLETDADYRRFGIERASAGHILTVDATGLRRLGPAPAPARDWERESLLEQPYQNSSTWREARDGSARIEGQVRDKQNGDSLAGVTIVATDASTSKTYNAMTDAKGRFELGELPVGTYRVLFVFGDTKTMFSDIRVRPDSVAKVHAKLDLGQLGGETVTIKGRALIDTTKTTYGVTIDRSFTENIPVPGRTFESVLAAAAGASNDGIGVSFSGSTSLENVYGVDGVNTTDAVKGTSSQARKQTPGRDAPDIRRFRRLRRLLAEDALGKALSQSLEWYGEAPGNLLAIVALGEALEAAGHYRLATRAYSSILDIYPSRSDMHRVAAAYLGRLGNRAHALRLDALRFAHEDRPDHVHGTRLLAMEMASGGQEREAIELLLKALDAPTRVAGRLESIRSLLRREVGIIAAAWLRRAPSSAAEIRTLLQASGIMVPMESERYAVLSWESDVARLQLRVNSTSANRAAQGQRTHVGSIGYGPESFISEEEMSESLELSAVFAEQAMMGFAFAQLQVVRLDALGKLDIDWRPFVALEENENVDLGSM